MYVHYPVCWSSVKWKQSYFYIYRKMSLKLDLGLWDNSWSENDNSIKQLKATLPSGKRCQRNREESEWISNYLTVLNELSISGSTLCLRAGSEFGLLLTFSISSDEEWKFGIFSTTLYKSVNKKKLFFVSLDTRVCESVLDLCFSQSLDI